jgi:hypothetical protein
MTWTKSLYPKNWEDIAADVKNSSGWICQGCGKTCRRSGEKLPDFIARLGHDEQGDVLAHPQKWTLTVAHLDHDPSNSSRSNLKALCAPCHCRLDTLPESLARKRQLKRERDGQLSLAVQL